MNNYNVNKEMIGVAAAFTVVFIVFPLLSLFSKVDCKTLTEEIKNEECNIQITHIEKHGYGEFKIEGINPDNFKPCKCETNNRWWVLYEDEMKTNDYFVKNKGESNFKIIKQDTTIIHEWKCSSE